MHHLCMQVDLYQTTFKRTLLNHLPSPSLSSFPAKLIVTDVFEINNSTLLDQTLDITNISSMVEQVVNILNIYILCYF